MRTTQDLVFDGMAEEETPITMPTRAVELAPRTGTTTIC